MSGFGCESEPNEALHWLSVSASKGSKLAESFLPFFENCRFDTGTTSSTYYFKELLRASFVMNKFHNRGGTVAAVNADPEELHEDTSDDGTYYGNKVNFEFACRSGNIQEVRSLRNLHLDGKERDGWGACPLHWIFMFPEGEIEEITRLLVSRASVCAAYRDALTSSYILVDPQFPVSLFGTPLAFATAVASVTAVRALLQIGADPDVEPRSYSREGSAWYIACKYHLANILRLFLEYIEQAPSAKSSGEKASYLLRLYEHSTIEFSEATYSERVFFHGNRTAEAAGRTALLLLHHFVPLLQFEGPISLSDCGKITFSKDLNTGDYIWSFNQAKIVAALCMRLVHFGDAQTISTVFEAVSDEIREPKYRRSIFNKLLLHCTTRACSGVLDIDDSLKILQACLDAGAHIDCAEEVSQGSLPINTVIQHGNISIFEWFIQQGADVTAKSARGDTPLHFAVSCGFSTKVNLSVFFAHGALADYENEGGISPLHLAITLDRENDLNEILDHLVHSRKTPKYQSLVESASACPNTERLSHILGIARKDPTSVNLNLTKALAVAIENERAESVRILVSSGAPVSCSYLHMAVFHGFEDSVRELLREDCLELDQRCAWPEWSEWPEEGVYELPVPGPLSQPSKKTPLSTEPFVAGWTALQIAAIRPQSRNCAFVLIDAGADVNVEDESGTTVVELAVRRPRVGDWKSLATKLFHKGHIRPLILLQRALANGDSEWATFLVRSGCPEGPMNVPEGNLLHFLADLHQDTDDIKKENLMFHFTRMIIGDGVDPRQTDKNGYTPLEISVLRNNAEVCAALLKYHTDGEVEVEQPKELSAGDLFGVAIDHKKKLLEQAWSSAIRFKAWACICAFHEADIMLPTTKLDFEDGCALFDYAFRKDIHATLRLFVGSHDGSGSPKPDWDPHLHQYWQTICIAERIISGCGSHIMDLKMGHMPIISLEKMTKLGYYEAQAEESLKECVSIDFGNNPDPSEVHSMWDVFFDRRMFFTTLSTDTDALNLGTFGNDYSQDEPGMSYKQRPYWGVTFVTDKNTGRVIDGGGFMGAQEEV